MFDVDTQMKADSNRSDGSSRKTFITTPVVLNSVTCEKIGGSGELSPDGPSENVSRMSTNCMTRSSSYLSKSKHSEENKLSTVRTILLEPWPL